MPAAVYAAMGYIAVIVVAIVLVPVVFMLFGKRPASGRDVSGAGNGVTHEEPASDQPTPRSGAVNKISPGARKKIPPG